MKRNYNMFERDYFHRKSYVNNVVHNFSMNSLSLTNVLYTVSVKGIMSQTDDDIPPTLHEVEAYKDTDSTWEVYTGTDSYRLETTYTLDLKLDSELVFQDIPTLESAILKSWQDMYKMNGKSVILEYALEHELITK